MRSPEGQRDYTDAQALSPALVTVPSVGYAPAPTSLQPLLPQQPVFVVQEVSPSSPQWGGAYSGMLLGLEQGTRVMYSFKRVGLEVGNTANSA